MFCYGVCSQSFITSLPRYNETYTESFCVAKYGAAYLDSVYVIEKAEDSANTGKAYR